MEQGQNPQTKRRYGRRQLPSEIFYNNAELSRLKYVKVIYTGLDGCLHEVKTDVKFIGDVLISVSFEWKEDFDINYPQEVTMKFITPEALYIAQATLQEIKKSDNRIYFSVIPPTKLIRQQKRRYVRIDLERPCVLAITDEKGHKSNYLTKSINLSACGVLLHNLETFDSNDIIQEKVKMSKFGCYHIILFLEPEVVLKLFAIYVRHEYVNGSHRYAFRFMNMKQKNIDLICKCVTNEQLRLLKSQTNI